MAENTTTARHARQITDGDGVSDQVAIHWANIEQAARFWQVEGRHRKAD